MQKVKLKKYGKRYEAKIRFGGHEWYDNSICKVSAPLELRILSYCKRSVTGLKNCTKMAIKKAIAKSEVKKIW